MPLLMPINIFWYSSCHLDLLHFHAPFPYSWSCSLFPLVVASQPEERLGPLGPAYHRLVGAMEEWVARRK